MSAINGNMPKITPYQISTYAAACALLGEMSFFWGPPGLGKSAGVKSYAESIGAIFIDVRLATFESVDLRGVPDVANGQAVWCPVATLPFKGNPNFPTDRPIVLFLDEMMAAAEPVQAAAFQLCHSGDRAVGEHELMDNVILVGASNMTTHRAGTSQMLAPLANRMKHFEVVSDLTSFLRHAAEAAFNPLVRAYLNFRPEHLNQFESALKSKAMAFATERQWESVGKIISLIKDPTERAVMLAASVGEGVAAELEAFIEIWEGLPSFDAIVSDPEGTPLPARDRRDILCAIVTMLGRKIEQKHADAVVTYVKRLPLEYQTIFVTDVANMKDKAPLIIMSDAVGELQRQLNDKIF